MTQSRRIVLGMLLPLLALSVPDGARAGSVTDQMAADIDRVFQTLADPALKANADGRRLALRALTRDLFDLTEMAARSLGTHWQRRTPEEREAFPKLLGPLIESHILMLDGAAGARIDYVGETVHGDRAVVRTRIPGTHGRGMSLDYRLVRRGERWLIYDLLVDDVSLVDNYRAQFQKIIRTASYAELVRKLAMQ